MDSASVQQRQRHHYGHKSLDKCHVDELNFCDSYFRSNGDDAFPIRFYSINRLVSCNSAAMSIFGPNELLNVAANAHIAATTQNSVVF
jgi:hypothetical protein